MYKHTKRIIKLLSSFFKIPRGFIMLEWGSKILMVLQEWIDMIRGE